jgi:hypothetical protein
LAYRAPQNHYTTTKPLMSTMNNTGTRFITSAKLTVVLLNSFEYVELPVLIGE